MTREKANKKLKNIMNSINIGSKVLYRIDISLEKIYEGKITNIKYCKYNCSRCKKFNCKGYIGIDNREPSCIVYDSHPNLILIEQVILEDFITEEEFMV